MEPTETTEPLDAKLHALFEREHSHVPAEPFSGSLLARVAAERRRRALSRRVLQVAGIGAVIALSPWLVAGSQLASAKLEELFGAVEDWLSTPEGMFVAALCAGVALIAVLRRRLSHR